MQKTRNRCFPITKNAKKCSHIHKMCKTFIAALALISCLFFTPSVHAKQFDEADVKAAFLYYFLHFINWPNKGLGDKNEPYKFCILEESLVTRSLEAILASPKAVNTAVEVRVLLAASDATECDYVYIDQMNIEYSLAVIAITRGKPILTVSENDAFAEVGGMIELKRESNKIRVIINMDVLASRGLKASSKLLNLADTVSTPNFQGAINVPAE